MADLDDILEEVFKSGRKISGRAYRAYKKHAEEDRETKAEKKRRKQIAKIRRDVRGRIGMMAVLPFLTFGPLFANLFGGNLNTVIFAGGALIGFAYGLFELRRGLSLEADELAAEAQSEAPPREASGPHKALGVLAVTGGMFSFALAGQSATSSILSLLPNALAIAGVAAAACLFTVGFRGLLGRSERALELPKETQRSLGETPLGGALIAAQDKLHDLYQAAARVPQEHLRAQALGVHEAAQAVIDELVEDPRDLSKARRFLVTYVDGALNLVSGFARQAKRPLSRQIEDKFSDTLGTIEQTFVAQLHKLRADDTMDLDIQMDVLDAQMKGEGVS